MNKFFNKNDDILLVLGGLDTSGGMFNYLKAWITMLEKECRKVCVCATPEVLDNLGFEGFTIDLPYHSDEKLKKIYKKLLFNEYKGEFQKIQKLVRQYSPSYIHFVDETIFFPQLKKMFSNYPNIITVHDPIYHPGQFKSTLTRLICFYSRVSYFFSKNLKIHLHSKRSIFPSILSFYSCKLIYPHPLPETMFKSVSCNPIPVIAFMGRIEKYKGIDLFIQSVREYEKRFSNPIKILIVGKGEISGMDSIKFKNTIKVVNEFVTDKQFHKYMSEIDALVLPYISATQSGVGYLAKAYEKKIICTDVGNLPDLIESDKDGYLIEKCPRSIANAIHKIAISQ